MKQILVLRGGALGDFLVTLPLLRALRSRWPGVRIEVVGNARAAELAVLSGIIDAAHSQAEARWARLYSKNPLPEELNAWLQQFGVIVSFWPDPGSDLSRHLPVRANQQFVQGDAAVTAAPAEAHFLGVLPALGIENTAPVTSLLVMPLAVQREAEERMAMLTPRGRCSGSCLATLDGSVEGPAPSGPRGRTPHENAGTSSFFDDANPPTRPRRSGALQQSGFRDNFTVIAVHPGSGSPRKNWPVDRWCKLIRQLDPHPVLVVLGEAEQALAPVFRASASARIQIADQWPLPVLAAALGRSAGYIGHDSGVSHLAAATGVPCVLLFGPTDPEIWAPPGEHVQVLQRSKCLEDISVSAVLSAYTRLKIEN